MKPSSFIQLAAVAAAVASVSAENKLFHVTAPKAVFADAMHKLDVWEVRATGVDDLVAADVYASPEAMNEFVGAHEAAQISIERATVDIAAQIEEEKRTTAACQTRTANYLNSVNSALYVDNAFFDCWRKYDQVFEFLDKLVEENPTFFTKINSVSKTVEGRDIPAYKISTGKRDKSLYTQGLIHAREWQAGSTGFYAISSFLDGIRLNDPTITSIFDEYDWYFVPILNLDGYKFAWESNRMWRKNRRENGASPWGGKSYGVDLNRNFGPAEYFNKGGDGDYPSGETYPGPKVLSEPETSGVYNWLKTIPNLKGAIDIHTYSSLVLRPFGNQENEAAEPWGSKLRALGDALRDRIKANGATYTSETAQQLYYAYGTFMDSMFMEFNNMPSITFELDGNSFIQPESTIRPVGKRITEALKQFVTELKAYYA